MADQQKKKRTDKKKKPQNKAYPIRDQHPMRVLRNILQSSGPKAVRAYAEEHNMTNALDRLVATSKWASRKMAGSVLDHFPRRLRVGRALKRSERRSSGKAYQSNPEVREAVHAEALAMDAQR